MLDIFLSALLAVVAILTAYLGVHVTLHPPESVRARLGYKVGFVACTVVTVGLVIWQGVQNQRERKRGAAQMEQLAQEIKAAKDETGKASQAFSEESTRRQQAERDMALMVQATGQATRTGVSQDIRNAPLNVQLNGQPVAINQVKMSKVAKVVTDGLLIRAQAPLRDAPVEGIEPWVQRVMTWWDVMVKVVDSECTPQASIAAQDMSGRVTMRWASLYQDDRIQNHFAILDRTLGNLTDLVKRPELCP